MPKKIIAKSQSRKYKKRSLKNMKGGRIRLADYLGDLPGGQTLLFNFESKKYLYEKRDNILYFSVLMWISVEEGDELELKKAGKLIDDGKKLEIDEPVYGLYGYSENVEKQQLKKGTYSIKKFVKSHEGRWGTYHEFDIVKDEAEVDNDLTQSYPAIHGKKRRKKTSKKGKKKNKSIKKKKPKSGKKK